jgi:hypothetical protein
MSRVGFRLVFCILTIFNSLSLKSQSVSATYYLESLPDRFFIINVNKDKVTGEEVQNIYTKGNEKKIERKTVFADGKVTEIKNPSLAISFSVGQIKYFGWFDYNQNSISGYYISNTGYKFGWYAIKK